MKIRNAIGLLAVVGLAACGGDSDSGAGGGAFAGVYQGTETGTLILQGQTRAGSGPITITIGGDGSVTINDEAGIVSRGTLDGTDFAASGSAQGVALSTGEVCEIRQVYTGSVQGKTITGTNTASLDCQQNGMPVDGSYFGNVAAALTF